mgnify:CR=1 FL=1
MLTEGSIAKGILAFAIPLFLGQLLQQFYNVADAWVVGNFADNDSFAAVSSAGSLTFLIIGFFNGIAIGGGVVISKYFGARDEKSVEVAIHTNFLFGLIASALSTIVGLILIPVFASSDADTRECASSITIVSACLFRRRINYYHV